MEMIKGTFRDNPLYVYLNKQNNKLHFDERFKELYDFIHGSKMAISKWPFDPEHQIFIALRPSPCNSKDGISISANGHNPSASCKALFDIMHIKDGDSTGKITKAGRYGSKGWKIVAHPIYLYDIFGFLLDLREIQDI